MSVKNGVQRTLTYTRLLWNGSLFLTVMLFVRADDLPSQHPHDLPKRPADRREIRHTVNAQEIPF
jgi:hypothetical protein